jgi:hypothetical protein
VPITDVTEEIAPLSLPLAVLLNEAHKFLLIRLAELLVHGQVIHRALIPTSLLAIHTWKLFSLLYLTF